MRNNGGYPKKVEKKLGVNDLVKEGIYKQENALKELRMKTLKPGKDKGGLYKGRYN